jgi:wyosine [tRNA(Phe)-imidazoG37] synthetase (radical SAM superfamily)
MVRNICSHKGLDFAALQEQKIFAIRENLRTVERRRENRLGHIYQGGRMTLLQVAISRGAASFWTTNEYVRPIVARRYGGLALEINVTRGKRCNLDCIYCNRERSTDDDAVDLEVLEAELDALLEVCASGEIFRGYAEFIDTPEYVREFTDVVISGTGEATTFENLDEVVSILIKLMARHGLEKHGIVLQSNASLLHRPMVADAVRVLEAHHGEIWCKLDAGSETLFNRIVRAAVPMSRVLANIAQAGRRNPVVIQSMFLKLDGRGPGEDEICEYLDRLNDLMMVGCRIKQVQLCTITPAARGRGIAPLSEETIDKIAGRVRGLGLQVATFYGTE